MAEPQAPRRPRAAPEAPPGALARARELAAKLAEVVDTDVLEWDAAKTPRVPRARVPVELVRVGPESDGAWLELLPGGRRSEVPAFLRRGDRGRIALVDGRFAGWVWLSRVTHRDPWSGLVVRLAPDEAYAYALWVEPEHRPSGVAGVLMADVQAEVHADPGLSRFYGWVDTRNRESQLLLRMLGLKDVQHVKRIHLLRRLGRQVPRSARPPCGPLSADGRHRTAGAPGQ